MKTIYDDSTDTRGGHRFSFSTSPNESGRVFSIEGDADALVAAWHDEEGGKILVLSSEEEAARLIARLVHGFGKRAGDVVGSLALISVQVLLLESEEAEEVEEERKEEEG